MTALGTLIVYASFYVVDGQILALATHLRPISLKHLKNKVLVKLNSIKEENSRARVKTSNCLLTKIRIRVHLQQPSDVNQQCVIFAVHGCSSKLNSLGMDKIEVLLIHKVYSSKHLKRKTVQDLVCY